MSRSPLPGDAGPECRASAHPAILEIAVPPGHSSLQLALAVMECLVRDQGAVVTEADVRSGNQASFMLRIGPSGAGSGEL